jgi:hypothetical protein
MPASPADVLSHATACTQRFCRVKAPRSLAADPLGGRKARRFAECISESYEASLAKIPRTRHEESPTNRSAGSGHGDVSGAPHRHARFGIAHHLSTAHCVLRQQSTRGVAEHAIYRIDGSFTIHNDSALRWVESGRAAAGGSCRLEAPRGNHAVSPRTYSVLLIYSYRQPEAIESNLSLLSQHRSVCGNGDATLQCSQQRLAHSRV